MSTAAARTRPGQADPTPTLQESPSFGCLSHATRKVNTIMHPETLLQVARFEHQQRVAEATREVSVLRALIAQRAQRRADLRRAAARALEAGQRGSETLGGPSRCEPVPRWAV